MSQNLLNQYRKSSLSHAKSEELILMLFTAAIRHVAVGRQHIVIKRTRPQTAVQRLKRISMKCRHLERALDILTYLQGILNHEKGGDVACNLDRLYTYMITQLVMANSRNDLKMMKVLIGILTELRDGWSEMLKQQAPGKTVTDQPVAVGAGMGSPYAPLQGAGGSV